MKKDKSSFEKHAQDLIELVLDSSGQERIFEELCRHEPKTETLGSARFSEEYVPAKLALGCVYWNGCCEVHQIEDKEIRNVFFKEVMKRFESPKSLAAATRFSESLYASNVNPDESGMLAIVGHLFDKLKLGKLNGDEDSRAIAPGFIFIMEVCDALKNTFETEFDDFIYADDHRHAS